MFKSINLKKGLISSMAFGVLVASTFNTTITEAGAFCFTAK